jgi:3-hydroxy-3-methylglutaryl CoA synthase
MYGKPPAVRKADVTLADYAGVNAVRSCLAAVNASLREGAISIVSPVAGLRPRRAARL